MHTRLDDFLKQHLPPGEEQVSWSLTSLILIICRLLNPSSELHIAEHYYKSTALSDLLGVPDERVNDDRLYRGLDKLLPHKDALETYLKNKLGSLFNLEFDILLYDVTSTYFEGQCNGNPLAKHGHSRDRRSDCKQVCIGLVVTKEGNYPVDSPGYLRRRGFPIFPTRHSPLSQSAFRGFFR